MIKDESITTSNLKSAFNHNGNNSSSILDHGVVVLELEVVVVDLIAVLLFLQLQDNVCVFFFLL